ncbi:MAG: uroporphyrinogen-III synthase [Kiritimatiellae bacterium]|nr:uroporphyrinogen-III synthase [Kiritimatiellia bacterium]
MGRRALRIAARPSPLSRAQVDEAVAALRRVLPAGTEFELVFAETPGDRDRTTPLSDPSLPDDFFTRDLDQLLLEHGADLAVHSAKDLPRRPPEGLTVAALLPGLDPRDALVLRDGVAWPHGVRVVGSSTPRRDAAVRALLPAAQTRPIRGNIEQRLAALDRGDYDAIVVAACALIRLGLAGRIHGYLPGDAAPLQGHLAVVARSEETDLIAAIRPLDFRRDLFDAPTELPSAPADWPADALLFTGTHPDHFSRLGPLVPWPMIQLEPRPLEERLAELERHWAGCDALVFASAFAARAFVHAWTHWAGAVRQTRRPRIYAVGPAAGDAAERLGFPPDATAHDFGGVGSLLREIPEGAARCCFYPASDRSPIDERRRAMSGRGIELRAAVFYYTRDHYPGPLPSRPFAGVVFTSPSTVAAWVRYYPGERLVGRRRLAIGPTTLRALREAGLDGEMIE